MPHYFLDVANSQINSQDEVGREFADLEAARAEAIGGIRSILRDELVEGKMDLNGEVRILDAERQLVLSVPYAEAVTILPPASEESPPRSNSK